MKSCSIDDVVICIYICVLLAFRDYTKMIIISSLIVFCYILIKNISLKMNKFFIEYIFYKLLFIFLCILSSLWSINPFTIELSISMCFRLMTNLSILLYIKNENKFVKFVKFIIYGSMILCVRILIVVPYSAFGKKRIGNYLAYDIENSYGNTGITYVLGVASALLIINKDTIIKNKKLKYFLIIIFSIFSLISGSKKQIFILLITIGAKLILKSKSFKQLLKNIILMLGIFGIIFYLVYKIPILYDAIGYRMETFINSMCTNKIEVEDLSTMTRKQFIKEAYNIFIKNPIIGVGIDSFKYYNSVQFTWAENNFLELLADLGVLGMVIYYLPHLKITKSLLIQYKRKNKFFEMNFILFLILIFIDLTMVSYNGLHLQLYLALLYGYFIIYMKKRD